jgi:hypothetical protein
MGDFFLRTEIRDQRAEGRGRRIENGGWRMENRLKYFHLG